MLRVEFSDIGHSTVYHILNLLYKSGEIARTSKGHYSTAKKQEYFYELSNEIKEMSSEIKMEYPLVDFQVVNEYYKYAGDI